MRSTLGTVFLMNKDVCRGSVTLVLLPLKYEIDDSVTVTVVLLGEAARCRLYLWARHRPYSKTETD